MACIVTIVVTVCAAMKLSTFLDRAAIKPSEFARQIGVPRQTLHRYLAGERTPRSEILHRIREVTNGEVTPNDFLQTTNGKEAAA